MCVIIYLPKEKAVTNADLRRCHKANPDSVGYMFTSEGKLQIKRFLTFRPFLQELRLDLKQYGRTSDFAIHFRIATSGKVDIDNCHPFKINADHGFVHNGVISGWGTGVCSDTNEFRTKILSPLAKANPKFMDCASTEELVRGYVGTYNKMVFMRKDGEAWILNANQGTWDRGVWFSNTYWRYEHVSTYGGYGAEDGFGHYDSWPSQVKGEETPTGSASPAISSKLLGLPQVECQGCGAMTIQQDKICNECWVLIEKKAEVKV